MRNLADLSLMGVRVVHSGNKHDLFDDFFDDPWKPPELVCDSQTNRASVPAVVGNGQRYPSSKGKKSSGMPVRFEINELSARAIWQVHGYRYSGPKQDGAALANPHIRFERLTV